MLDMMMKMMGLDPKDIPDMAHLVDVLKTVPPQLDRMERKLNVIGMALARLHPDAVSASIATVEMTRGDIDFTQLHHED